MHKYYFPHVWLLGNQPEHCTITKLFIIRVIRPMVEKLRRGGQEIFNGYHGVCADFILFGINIQLRPSPNMSLFNPARNWVFAVNPQHLSVIGISI
jgi:hypothetical protein